MSSSAGMRTSGRPQGGKDRARRSLSPEQSSKKEVEESLSPKKKPRIGNSPDPSAMDEDGDLNISAFKPMNPRLPSEGPFSLRDAGDSISTAGQRSAPPAPTQTENTPGGIQGDTQVTGNNAKSPTDGSAANPRQVQPPCNNANKNIEPTGDGPDALTYLDIDPNTLPQMLGRTALHLFENHEPSQLEARMTGVTPLSALFPSTMVLTAPRQAELSQMHLAPASKNSLA